MKLHARAAARSTVTVSSTIIPPGTAAGQLRPARGPGHLAAGSDPAALPGDVLIVDEYNRRLLLVDPYGRTRWRFPGPGALGRGQVFGPPDDAFVSPDGRSIVATQEENQTTSVIDIAADRITRWYGHPGCPGPGPATTIIPTMPCCCAAARSWWRTS
jgi:DNA-binding beta-propeller fold protein YncE